MCLVRVEVNFLVCFARVVEGSGADCEVSQLGGAWVWAEDGGEASLANVSISDEWNWIGKRKQHEAYLEFGIFLPVVRVQLLKKLFVVWRLCRHFFDIQATNL